MGAIVGEPVTAPRLELTLMGSPRLRCAAEPIALSPGPSLLCAYLALSPGEGRRREVAAAQLFADSPEPLARRRLSTALWRLSTEVRSAVGIDLVARTHDDRVRLSPSVEMSLDTTAFEALVLPALGVRPECLTAELAASLRRAVALHGGELVEQCRDDWVLVERSRIEALYLTALDYLVVHHGQRGEHAEVSRYGELALTLEPLREDVHRHVMSAYAAAGRDDLVERQFERCRRVLVDELGVDPMPETVALYSRLRHGSTLVPPSLAPPSLAALRADLERARRDVDRLACLLDRTLDHLRQRH
jgi:DNA-binding SARP family transcriptional activator